MRCGNCRKEIDDTCEVCPFCGIKILNNQDVLISSIGYISRIVRRTYFACVLFNAAVFVLYLCFIYQLNWAYAALGAGVSNILIVVALAIMGSSLFAGAAKIYKFRSYIEVLSDRLEGINHLQNRPPFSKFVLPFGAVDRVEAEPGFILIYSGDELYKCMVEPGTEILFKKIIKDKQKSVKL